MTPDFTDTIELGDDPFSAEYWGNHRVAPLLEAMCDVMADEPDYTKYIAYWHTRCKGDDAEARRIGECYRELAAKIKSSGYTRNAWQRDGRGFDVTQGHGPMSVEIGDDGRIWPIDGSHRACILRILEKPVMMWVWRRRPKWVALKTFHKTLYTPYPHPDFAGHPGTRRGTERFEPIPEAIGTADSNRIGCRVGVVGSCTGSGSIELAKAGFLVTAFEPNNERCSLMRYLAARDKDIPTLNLAIGESQAHEIDYFPFDSVVALSVYQHAAASAARWDAICDKLAKCPRHILELPGNHEHQWHERFRSESDGQPQEAIIRALRHAGRYNAPEVIYTDHTYANRQTILLQR